MFRYMRIIVMFDLPSVSSREIKIANNFRKFLKNNGFLMMTESVYSKLVLNKSVSNSIKKLIKMNTPKRGLVQLLEITERQYNNIEYFAGESNTNIINSIDKYIEI